MLHKTKGIVLHTLPYNDRYIVVNMFTEAFGRAAYIIINSKGKRSGTARTLFSPLAILDMEVEHLNNRDLHRIREAKPAFIAMQLHSHPAKSAIALFLAETLYRLLQEHTPNPKLFDFLCDAIKYLDVADSGVGNFHLALLIQLSEYIGIHPNRRTYTVGSRFDMRNGVFTTSLPEHDDFLSRDDSLAFERLLHISFSNMSLFAYTRAERISILTHILRYYRLHLSDFPEIKSLAVLQALFD
jgi:DNA repair protein RecO (recombination protein O)